MSPTLTTRRGLVGGAAAAGALQALAPWTGGSAAAKGTRPCDPTPPGLRRTAVAVSRDGRTVWTADGTAPTITAHRARDLRPIRTIDVGGAAIGLAIAPDGRHALVTTAPYDRPGLALVDVRAGRLLDRLDAGAEPYAVAYEPDGRRAWVAGGGEDGTLRRIDVQALRAGAPLELGRHPRGIAVEPDGDHLLVALNGDASVARVALGRGHTIRRIATPPLPYAVVVAPGGSRAYVTHGGFRERRITPLDLAAGRARRPLRGGAETTGVALDASGTRLVAAGRADGTVTVLDTRTGARRRRARGGGAPRAVAVHGRRAYVADGDTGLLTTIRI